MTDPLIDPALDLSIQTLMKACKGNVKMLPSFVVHDDAVWPVAKRVQLDKKNRIHLRRSTFYRCVSSQVPVRPGLWLRSDAQEYFIDLKPHHLQGSEDMKPESGHEHSREIVKADKQGRTELDEDYGEPVSRPAGIETKPLGTHAELAAHYRGRGVRSTVGDSGGEDEG